MKKIVTTKTIVGDSPDDVEIALIELAHDMAMSRDPTVAVRGRFMKATGLAFVRWMVDERDRFLHSPDPGAAAAALANGYAQAIAQDITTLHHNLTPEPDIQRLGMTSQADLVLLYVRQAAALMSERKQDLQGFKED
jgi:hypothetical protein